MYCRDLAEIELERYRVEMARYVERYGEDAVKRRVVKKGQKNIQGQKLKSNSSAVNKEGLQDLSRGSDDVQVGQGQKKLDDEVDHTRKENRNIDPFDVDDYESSSDLSYPKQACHREVLWRNSQQETMHEEQHCSLGDSGPQSYSTNPCHFLNSCSNNNNGDDDKMSGSANKMLRDSAASTQAAERIAPTCLECCLSDLSDSSLLEFPKSGMEEEREFYEKIGDYSLKNDVHSPPMCSTLVERNLSPLPFNTEEVANFLADSITQSLTQSPPFPSKISHPSAYQKNNQQESILTNKFGNNVAKFLDCDHGYQKKKPSLRSSFTNYKGQQASEKTNVMYESSGSQMLMKGNAMYQGNRSQTAEAAAYCGTSSQTHDKNFRSLEHPSNGVWVQNQAQSSPKIFLTGHHYDTHASTKIKDDMMAKNFERHLGIQKGIWHQCQDLRNELCHEQRGTLHRCNDFRGKQREEKGSHHSDHLYGMWPQCQDTRGQSIQKHRGNMHQYEQMAQCQGIHNQRFVEQYEKMPYCQDTYVTSTEEKGKNNDKDQKCNRKPLRHDQH